MDKKIEVAIKIGSAAVLSFVGNALEKSGNKFFGQALNIAGTALLTWALKDAVTMAAHETTDDDHAV